MVVIQCTQVGKSFDGRPVLVEASVSVRAGQITGLSGENGSGKTTLINILSGIVKPDQGHCSVFGRDVRTLSRAGIASLGLIRTFQSIRVVRSLTVDQHLRLALQASDEHGWASLMRRSAAEPGHAVAAQALADRVGLTPWFQTRLSSLSFGQQKAVSVVSAVAARPRVLLLDEPFAGLHLAMIEGLSVLLREAVATGVAILVVDHNADLLGGLADEHWMLVRGRIQAYERLANGIA